MHGRRFSAIDIGSNAIRMVIAEYTPRGFRSLKKYRIPIRLGADVFDKGKISGKNLKSAARAFRKFQQISNRADITAIRAVGTSALRESKNKQSFVELIRRKSQIQIEIIDGTLEGKLIHQAVSKELHLESHQALLIDIGGGSVELTTSLSSKIISTQSFPFGTVRTLNLLKKKGLNESQLGLIVGEFLPAMSQYLKKSHDQVSQWDGKYDFAVGTGGNLEALGRLKSKILKRSSRSVISLIELELIIQRLKELSIRERIDKLDLRPDRADVILPAATLVASVMKQAQIDRILIPYVGLKDGLLWSMLEKQ